MRQARIEWFQQVLRSLPFKAPFRQAADQRDVAALGEALDRHGQGVLAADLEHVHDPDTARSLPDRGGPIGRLSLVDGGDRTERLRLLQFLVAGTRDDGFCASRGRELQTEYRDSASSLQQDIVSRLDVI